MLDCELSVIASSRRRWRHGRPFRPRKTVTGTESWKPPWCLPVFPSKLATEARELAMSLAEAMRYVGVLGVELFVVGGRLLVNEMAPRPHNSGHYTVDACSANQFEQQLRALVWTAAGPAVAALARGHDQPAG